MSNQLQITGGAKVRNLEGVLTGTSGVVSSVPLGAANGVATLDSGGKVPVSQLPSSVVTYLGTWNAATNTPTLTNGVGDAGDMYICNVAGTVNFGAGPVTFAVGDWVLYGSGTWQKSSGQNGTVTSVGASITGNAIGLTGSPITTAGTLAFAFAGTNLQYVNGAGNLVTFPTTIAQAQRLITEVYNETGATLTKGTVVYINGGHGNLPTVTKAIATGDSTSAQTYGVVQTDITDNNNGYVVVLGSLGDLDTQAYAAGTQLYLSSTTAGAWTSTKQYAPAHLVYVGIVVRSHPTQGVVEVRIQNGFELDELHNVSAQTPSNNQGLFYNSSTQLWENKSIATALGYTPANDASVVHLAGTETITGIKTFSNGLNTDYIGITGDMTMDGSFLLKHVAYGTLQSGYTNLSGQTNGLRVGLFGGYNALLNFSTSGSYTYTFPNATGTIALTSDIPSLAGYVTLATTQTITGAKTFNSGTKFDLGLFLKESSSSGRLSGYVGISATATGGMQQLQFLYPVSGSSVFSLPTTGSFNYEFPAASGTVALLEFSQTFSGLQSFTNTAGTDLTYGAYLTKNSIPSFSSSLTVNLYSASGNNNLVIRDNGNTSKLQFQATSSYTYTFPASTGTLALTTDIPSITGLVPYTGATTDVTLGNFSITGNVSTFKNSYIDGSASTNGQLMIKQAVLGSTNYAGYTSFYSTGTNISLLSDAGSSNYKSAILSLSSLTNNTARTYTLPDASGTIALVGGSGVGTVTSVAALTIGTTGTDLSSTVANSTTTPVITLNVPTASATNRGALSSADWTTFNNKQNALTNPVTGTGTTNYLPKFTGTSTIGNSLVYDNGSNIKITTTDYSPFYVNSTNANNWGSNIVFQQSGTDFGYFGALGSLLGSTDKGMTIYANTGNSIYLYTSGSNRLQVFSGGNIGIGTGGTDSGYKLDVNGTGRFSGRLNADGNIRAAYLDYVPSGVETFIIGKASYNVFDGNQLAIGTFTALPIEFATNNVKRLTIASTGAATFTGDATLGGSSTIFGTTGSKFYVYPAFSTNLNLLQNYNGSAYTTEEHRASDYSFKIGTTSALTIASTGAATFSSSVTATYGYFSGTGAGSFNSQVTLNNTTSSPALIAFQNTANGHAFGFTSTGTQRFTFINGGLSEIASITSAGAATFSSSVTAGAGSRLIVSGSMLLGEIISSYSTIETTTGNGIWLRPAGVSSPSGMFLNTSGNVGIGTTSPAYKLVVNAGGTYLIGGTSDSSGYTMIVQNSSNNNEFLVRNDGLISFPTTTSTWTTGNAANAWINPTGGDLYRSTSSIKYKKNVQDYTKGLAEVMQLRPVSYEGIGEIDSNQTFAGLIAEEVHDLGLTEFVQYAEDGTPDALAYQNMIALAFKAIQELKAEIEELKNK